MYILKAGEGCVLKMRLVEANGAPIELRNARFVQAILHLPNEATMLCEDVRFDEVSQLVFVRLSAKSELTMEGVYGININALFDGRRVVTSAVLDFAEVKANAESRYYELLIDLIVSTTDVPSCVKYTGASPKISENGTWLVFNDEINAFEDTGISIFGKSAYQAAIESGIFSGTEDDFNAYMGSIPQVTNDAILATESANNAAIEANKAGAEAVRIARESAQDATTAKDNAEQATEQAIGATASANEAAQRANEEVQKIKEKADTDGYYPTMTVGKSNNLVGRGDVQDAQINFRPSAGADNISDAAARIVRIKGNSVVYNQLAKSITENISRSYYSYDEQTGLVTMLTEEKANNRAIPFFGRDFANSKTVIGHIYMVYINGNFGDFLPQVSFGGSYPSITNGYAIVEAKSSATAYLYPFGVNATIIPAGATFYLYNWKVIDLTQMFGAGNEPTTVEEYYQRKPMNIDEYVYNEGELIDMKVDSLVSVGDNLFDKSSWQRGSMAPDGIFTPKSSSNRGCVLLKCIPNTAYYGVDFSNGFVAAPLWFYDEQMNFIKYDCVGTTGDTSVHNAKGLITSPDNAHYVRILCSEEYVDTCSVSLVHSGYKAENYKYIPYQQDVKDLSWISEIMDSEGNQLFPNGMRSAGNAFDEIRFNKTTKKWEAVKRIGELKLADIPKSKCITIKYNGYDGFLVKNLDINAVTDMSDNHNVLMNIYVKGGFYIYKSGLDKAFEFNHGYYGGVNNIPFLAIRDTDYADIDSLVASFENNNATLYYELAEPIIEEIEGSENWNLDYLVWDFGTEEVVASVPSAPFRADINYEPNAVDDLRWAVSEIRSLQAELAQLQSVQASETNLTE